MIFAPPVGNTALFHRRGLMPVVNHDGTAPHPAPRAPRFFADSATRADVEPLLRAGIVNGLTTNPTLLKKAGAKSWSHAKEIMRDLCALFRPHPVSLELTALDGQPVQLARAREVGGHKEPRTVARPRQRVGLPQLEQRPQIRHALRLSVSAHAAAVARWGMISSPNACNVSS